MSDEKTPETVVLRFHEIRQALASKAFSDSDFRDRLLADPQATITSEYGLPVGALQDLDINIIEEQPGVLTIPIPPSVDALELTDEQLEQVAGGDIMAVITLTYVTYELTDAIADKYPW